MDVICNKTVCTKKDCTRTQNELSRSLYLPVTVISNLVFKEKLCPRSIQEVQEYKRTEEEVGIQIKTNTWID